MAFQFGSPIVGTATPQQQQQPMFGAPLASSTPAQTSFGVGTPQTSQAPSLFGTGTPGAAPAGGTTGFNFAPSGFSTGGTTTSQASSLFGTGTTAAVGSGAPGQPSLFGTGITSSTAAPQQQQTSLFGSTNPTAGGTGTSFSFSNPTTSQPTAGGFSLGGGIGGTPGGGFSFGGGAPPAPTLGGLGQLQGQGQGQPLQLTQQTAVQSFQGLGGIPGNPTPRISTLAVGGDPGTGWSTRNDNRNVQEMPVPQEIIQIVEELKNQMKNHKQAMMQVTRTFDTVDIDMVAEQIEEVRLSVITLSNVMHKQELQSASLIKDMQELSKEMDLLSQARDVPGYSSTNLLYNFLFDLVSKYGQRMAKYKVEIERAEFSLQTSVGTSFSNNINAKDLWDSLAAIKDTVILLAAQVQQLQEDLRKELLVHKNLTQVVFGQQPNKWLNNALSNNAGAGSGGGGGDQNVPPLERMLSTPSKHQGQGGQGGQGQGQGVGQANSLETIYQRTYSMFNRGTSTTDSRAQMGDVMRTPSQAANLGGGGGAGSGTGFGSPSFHPSMMGSYLGPSGAGSPGAGGNASLKRSKK